MNTSNSFEEVEPGFLHSALGWGARRSLVEPVLGRIVLTILFGLLSFREFNSADGAPPFLYSEVWGGFRCVDLLIFGLIYFHLLWMLISHRNLPSVPNMIKQPALLFFGATAMALIQGLYQHGSHLYFDWRDIVLGVCAAAIFAYWVKSAADLQRGINLFVLVTGIRILYLLVHYAFGGGTEGGVPGMRTPIYDGPTLNAVVFIVLLAFGNFRIKSLSMFTRFLWMVFGVVAFMLAILSFRRAIWGELLIGMLLLIFLAKRKRLATLPFLVVISLGTIFMADEQLYLRIQSINPFAENSSPYATTNEDHVGDVLDAFDHVKEHPILGIGLGRPYSTNRIRAWKTESWEVHNALIHVWLFYGFLGLIAYLWFHIGLFRWLRRLQAEYSNYRVQVFYQAGLAWMMGQFLISCSFAPWPYGAIQTNVLIFFIIGTALSLQRNHMRSKTNIITRKANSLYLHSTWAESLTAETVSLQRNEQ
jgi:O-Antigen ligase